MVRIYCSGKKHPNAARNRASEDCEFYIELENPVPSFSYLCRHCSPVASPPPNTFAGKQFDKSIGKGGNSDPEKSR